MATLNRKPKLQTLLRILSGPYALALVPLLTLGAYELFGHTAMIVTAIGFPIIIGIVAHRLPLNSAQLTKDTQTGVPVREVLVHWARRNWADIESQPQTYAVVTVSVDDLPAIEQRFGRDMRNAILSDVAHRIKSQTRSDDLLVRFGTESFALALSDIRAPDVENLLHFVRRLKSAFDEPFREGAQRTYCSVSCGIVPMRMPDLSQPEDVAEIASDMIEVSLQSGPGAVRLFSHEHRPTEASVNDATAELVTALETGQIVPHFQPQVTTDAGHVIGFEALARWEHPDRGMIAPAGFLPEIERSGLSQRLTEVILRQALQAITAWEKAGSPVHTVSVNFSGEELQNPRLADYVRWELDRNELSPDRLVVEVLESVISDTREDTISKTLTALSQTGCLIDLDDFGTGYTSILNIRRFAVSRIKLDRCIVAHLDKDEEQRRMVAGLLALGERLGTQTLAEGVETPGERAMLARLGCPLIQGFVVARPMSLQDAQDWLKTRRIADPETIRVTSAFPPEDTPARREATQ